ncbi:zinc-binding protein A33-like [Protopterus annectens]|uniref:zinc-binding protein A33-like n=1 Tax=Protopterus annectens TaxID=7888 RepID=UPI001CF9D536|nr:zinc-binding protein A33-like [Protopterus annectens]
MADTVGEMSISTLSESKQEHQSLNMKEPSYCTEHGEIFKLFCEDDQKTICVVCGVSREHKPHDILPIQEACEMYKVKLEKALQLLQNLLKLALENLNEEEEKTKRLLIKGDYLKQQVVDAFSTMHQFLDKEEKSFLMKLESEQIKKMEHLESNRSYLQTEVAKLEQAISVVQVRLECVSPTAMLKEIKDFLTRMDVTFQKPPEISVGLYEFNCPIQYEVWKKMTTAMYPALSPITLDPKTASPWLILSDDLTAVSESSIERDVADSPERFYSGLAVLGSEGFTSGKHYWEVEVGNKTRWELGVAQESANRNGTIILSPNNGFWALTLREKDQYRACSSPPTPLSIRGRPTRIGVYIDYDAGQISFYNAHSMEHLHTFVGLFSEKLFPYLCPGNNDGGKNSEPLKMFAPQL